MSPRQIAALIEEVRKQQGLTSQQVAEELGISKQHIHQAETQPHRDLLRVRRRLLEYYTGYTIEGPFYQICKK